MTLFNPWICIEFSTTVSDVTSLDGTRGAVNNSIYTNAMASLALHYSKYAACLCNIDVNIYAPQEWIHAAHNIRWEYNTTLDYNPEYQGYITTGTLLNDLLVTRLNQGFDEPFPISSTQC